MVTKKIISTTIHSIDNQLSRIVEERKCGICLDTCFLPLLPKKSKCKTSFDIYCIKNTLKFSHLHPLTRESLLPNGYVIDPYSFSLSTRTMRHFDIVKDLQISELRELLNSYPSYKSYILSRVTQEFSSIETLYLEPELKNNAEFMRQVAHEIFSKALDHLLHKPVSVYTTESALFIVKELIRCRFFDLANKGLKIIKQFLPIDSFQFDLSILESKLGLADEAYASFLTCFDHLPKVTQSTPIDTMTAALFELIKNKCIPSDTAYLLLSKVKLKISDCDNDTHKLSHSLATDATINLIKCEIFLEGYESIKPHLSEFKNPLYLEINTVSDVLLQAIAEIEFLENDYESFEKTLEILKINALTKNDLCDSLWALKNVYLFHKKFSRLTCPEAIQDLIKEKSLLAKQFYSDNSFYSSLFMSKENKSKTTLSYNYMFLAQILIGCDLREDAEKLSDEALDHLMTTNKKSREFSRNLTNLLLLKIKFFDAKEEVFNYEHLLSDIAKLDIMNHLLLNFIKNGQIEKAIELLESYNPTQDYYESVWSHFVFPPLISYYQEKEMLIDQLFAIYSQSKDWVVSKSLSSLASHIALKADPSLTKSIIS